jgi:hypothetical protein
LFAIVTGPVAEMRRLERLEVSEAFNVEPSYDEP